jgi:hypothetical protein
MFQSTYFGEFESEALGIANLLTTDLMRSHMLKNNSPSAEDIHTLTLVLKTSRGIVESAVVGAKRRRWEKYETNTVYISAQSLVGSPVDC